MGGKDLREAAERAAKRKEILKRPVPMRDDDPENMYLSKEKFIEKRRKEKEESVAMVDFKKEYRAKKQAEVKEEPKEVKEETKAKKGRPKRIE